MGASEQFVGNIPPVSLNRVLMTLTNGIRLPIFDIVPLCNIESRRLNDNFGNILFDNILISSLSSAVPYIEAPLISPGNRA